MRDSTHIPRRIISSPFARTVALTTMVAALGAPAAHAADWTAPRVLLTHPPLFDAFRLDAAGNADGVEAFTWFRTTRKLRRDPQGTSGYLRYVQARLRLADGRLTRTRTVSRKDAIVNTPLVGIDRHGTMTVVWQENRRRTKLPFVMVAVARRGKRFGTPLALGRANPPGELVSGPTLAVSSSGAAVVAWTQSGRMVATRRPPNPCPSRSKRLCFGSLQRLSSRPSRPVGSPAVAIGPGSAAFVAFATDKPAMRLSSSLGRHRFARSQRLSPVGQPATLPSVAAGFDGSAVVAWRRAGEDTGIERRFGPIMAASRDASGNVSAAHTVDPTEAGNTPEVRTNPQGEAILAWGRHTGEGAQVVAAVRPAGASFGPPALLAPFDGPGLLEVDGRGNAIIVFGSQEGIAAVVRPPGGSFGAPIVNPLGGLNQLVTAGDKVTAAWVSETTVRASDLRP
ncbi:MAG: hypothetical protein M3401_05795 [Actinomycetota bacterium]|nr:hypothetical protein [Actinomycetota bacterium]